MENIQLRPYQQRAVSKLREAIRAGDRRLILCAPTGAGKTVIFSYMAARAVQRQRKVLILTDRIELLKQSGGALNRMGLIPVEIKAGSDPQLTGAKLYTAMIETLSRRMRDARYQRLVSSFDLIVLDEAHKQSFNKLFQYINDSTVVIGATATPYRKGKQKALSDFYQGLIEVTDIPSLVQEGYLARPLSYGVAVDLSKVSMKAGEFDERSMSQEYSRNQVYRGVIDNYKRITPGKKALAFSASIESSQELCTRMQEAGINAQHLDSNMTAWDRQRALSWFRGTPDAVLCNVGILTTGFDCPEVEAVILYRATTSLPLFLQMVGRGSRVASGKSEFYILDFGENIQRHGFWEQPRQWSLEKAKKRKKQDAAPVKDCPGCQALVFAAARSCVYCGHEFTLTQKEQDAQEVAELMLLTPRERRAVAAQSTLEERARMAKAKVIKPFWVIHQLETIEEARQFAQLMGWKWPGWWHYNKHRFPNLSRKKVEA